jgi:streptogramin lyase
MDKSNRVYTVMLGSVLVLAMGLASAWAHAAETIETIAGNGEAVNSGDAGPATEIAVGEPFGVEIGPDGALYITEVKNHRVRRLDLGAGTISTVVGNGAKGYSGDGGPALKASLNEPYEVRFDADGNMFFVEMQNHIVRKVDVKNGQIETVAGTGKAGFRGDGGPAIKAMLSSPHSIALDGSGGLYIADIGNHRIRRVDLKSGVIETIAGNGGKQLPQDGGLARGNPILGPRALFINDGVLWIALREGNSVWRLDLETGRLVHVAGTGAAGYTGDGGPAKEATFDGPKGIAVGPGGDVFVVDTENHAIRRIDGKSWIVSTVAGGGLQSGGFGGDGGRATSARMDRPHGICVGPDGALYIGDTSNHRVRRVR